MSSVHEMREWMAKQGPWGADWLTGAHEQFGHTAGYSGADIFNLLGDQRVSFDLVGSPQDVACREPAAAPAPKP